MYALRAGRDELIRRTLMRGQGLATQLPGDELVGRSEAHLREVAAAAAQRDAVLRASIVPDVHVETDELAISDIATRIASDAFAKVGDDAS